MVSTGQLLQLSLKRETMDKKRELGKSNAAQLLLSLKLSVLYYRKLVNKERDLGRCARDLTSQDV